jgi:UDP-2,3-diacylglucosamine pyrophosphatase LpxH
MLIEHFDLARHRVENEVMHLSFEERNIVPKEESERILIAHGF